jgi:hypothetical protein
MTRNDKGRMKTIFTILIGSFVAAACTSSPKNIAPKNYERVYRASFEETWRAVQQSIISYPLKVNNMDVGQIQTTPVRGSTQFKPPHLENMNMGGNRYTLTINVLKESPKTTKVTILKDMVLHRDFISTPEAQASDGYEESVVLYRIGREIDIERAITRESKQKAQAPSKK